MLTRCSSFSAERDSSNRRAITSKDLSPTWNSSDRCAAAQGTIGVSSFSRRSAPKRPRKFDDHTSLSPLPTTPHSRRASKRFVAKFEFEGSFRGMLRTHAQAGTESVAAFAARTTDVCSKAYPNFRRIQSCRALWITSFMD